MNMDKRTKRIINIYIGIIVVCSCLLYGFLLYDSHRKGTNGEAYDIKLQDNSLMFIADMSSSIKLDEIESVQFYEEKIPERNSIKIGTETNKFLTGKTSLKGIGNCYVYGYKDKSYYIKLVTENRIFVFNLFDKEETISLFEKLTLYQDNDQKN